MLEFHPQLLLLSSATAQEVGGWIRCLMAGKQGKKEVGSLISVLFNCLQSHGTGVFIFGGTGPSESLSTLVRAFPKPDINSAQEVLFKH